MREKSPLSAEIGGSGDLNKTKSFVAAAKKRGIIWKTIPRYEVSMRKRYEVSMRNMMHLPS